MLWPMIRSTRDHFFKKRFSKLNFLKTASVTIIANNEKMKMKKSHLSMTYTFPLQIFLKIDPSAQFFGNFILPPKPPPPPLTSPQSFKKKSWTWRRVENYVYSSKNLIFDSFLYSCQSI